MSWDSRQLRTFRTVLEEVDRRGLDEVAGQQALAVVIVECSGLNYANPLYPWTLPGSDGYPPTALASSTKESCGITQIRPHIPVWWGPEGLSIREQALYFMSPVNSINLFLDRLAGTVRTDQPWRQIQQVQGSEYDGVTRPYAANYQGAWAAAGALLAQLRTEQPDVPPTSVPTFIEGVLMAKAVIVFFEHPEGTVYEADLLTGVYYHVETLEAYNQRRDVLDYYGVPYGVEKDVPVPAKFGTLVVRQLEQLEQGITTETPLHSRITESDWPAETFFSGMDEKSAKNGAALVAIAEQAAADATKAAAGVAGLAAQLADIVATLAAQDAASIAVLAATDTAATK